MPRKKRNPPDPTITVGNISNASGIAIGHGAQVTITNIIQSQAASVLRPLHQLPQPPADFTGREELIAQLLADFEKIKGATITGLTGMGGIGKTALGLVVAGKVAKDYPDAQIFLDLKGTTSPLSAMDIMRHVILSFEPTIDIRTLDDANMSATYQSVLHEKKVLLFLDNARSAEQVAPLRPPETCAMLVTSRWVFGVPGLQPRRVDLMSEKNAEAFLLEMCPRIGNQSNELAKACAYLPLALRIAASFLGVNKDWGVEEYIRKLNDRKQRLGTLEQSYEEAELKTEPSLLATFELSYQQLSEENKKHWRMLGVFPTPFYWIAAAAIWDLEEDTAEGAARKLLGLLLRYSLLDYDESSSRYGLYDLLVDYALSKMNAEEEGKAHLKHASYYKDVLSVANSLYLEGGENVLTGLRLFDLEWENIRNSQAWVSQNADNKDYLELCNEYPNAGYMILSLRSHPSEYMAWLEKGLEAARKLDNKEYQGYHLGNLGVAYENLGEAHKAIEFYEKALGIDREIGDRRGEATALGNLGTVYYLLGEVHKAVDFHEQRLAIVREIGDRRGEGQALGNLGNAYYSLGEVHKAIEFYEKALVIDREIGDRLGEEHDLGNLGVAYEDLGEVHKAIEFYEKALVIDRELGDRHGEGNTLGSLGDAYYSLGEAYKAIEFHEQRLAIAREIDDRRGEGNALGSLGDAYYSLGEIRKVIEFHEQALVIDRELGDRLGEGNALGNLGIACFSLGDAHKAIEFHEQALVIDREIGYRRGEGNALGSLGNAYADIGDSRKAIEFYEGHLAIAREIGDRSGEGITLGNLGIAYENLGEVHKAIQFYERSLAIARELGDRLGEGNALFNMGLALYSLEENDRAIDLVRQALEIFEAIESPNAEGARDQLKEWGAL